MFNLVGITGVMETLSGFVGETITLIQFPEQQADGIRGYPATLKIGDDFLGEKAFKGKLIMAYCDQSVSCLRSCLFSYYSMLADIPSFLRTFHELFGLELKFI